MPPLVLKKSAEEALYFGSRWETLIGGLTWRGLALVFTTRIGQSPDSGHHTTQHFV